MLCDRKTWHWVNGQKQGEAAMENSRREMMAGACAAAAMTFAPATLAAWEPSQRYPDPAVQSLDPSFNKYRLALAGVERLATGCRFSVRVAPVLGRQAVALLMRCDQT